MLYNADVLLLDEPTNHLDWLVEDLQSLDALVAHSETKMLLWLFQRQKTLLWLISTNYVETTVQAKDLMYKKTRRRMSYSTEDGFAVGYILAILDQGEQFDTVHLFEEVEPKYNVEDAAYHDKQSEREKR
ncbi:hypothetical protein PsorP6_017728 [Peronosclerospora sorghi]|uniref:Uncharacterized protein n=1 Tax=Peronosclerospora sorghi TaxID=230839 RepID=A0ACC0WLT6_9STRA|nr:hypothetical protein PsorP6_017728 [Peronosclerospora sorghi]